MLNLLMDPISEGLCLEKKRSIVYIYIRLYIPLLLRHSLDLLCDGFLAPLVPLGVLSSGLEMEDALQEIQKAVEAGEV